MWQRARGADKGSLVTQIVCVVATFHFVCLAWIFFRAPTFAHAMVMIERIGALAGGVVNLAPKVVLVLAVGLVAHFVPKRWDDRLRDAFAKSPSIAQGILLAAAAIGIHLAAGAKAEPFVYGQF
jgi:hypothetical protein